MSYNDLSKSSATSAPEKTGKKPTDTVVKPAADTPSKDAQKPKS